MSSVLLGFLQTMRVTSVQTPLIPPLYSFFHPSLCVRVEEGLYFWTMQEIITVLGGATKKIKENKNGTEIVFKNTSLYFTDSRQSTECATESAHRHQKQEQTFAFYPKSSYQYLMLLSLGLCLFKCTLKYFAMWIQSNKYGDSPFSVFLIIALDKIAPKKLWQCMAGFI